jgi:uncharacterized protein YecE (DUF72 family)
MVNKVLIGTSGWSYDDWVGQIYPKSLAKKDFLLYYSTIFYTNEINTTFYNIPSRGIVQSWLKRTPSDFLFTAKLPKIITHECKLDLDKCSEDLIYFLDVMDPLINSGKFLAFLVQLPPSFQKDHHYSILKEFIANWPQEYGGDSYHLAIEFRHKSWMDEEVFRYLKENTLTYCAVIEPLLPPRMEVTNPEFSYVRFHGFGKKIWFNYFFNEQEIKNWAIALRGVIENSKKVGIYFNNHFSGYAVKNSLMMMNELGLKPRNEPKEIKIFEIKKKSGSYTKGQTSLEKFF